MLQVQLKFVNDETFEFKTTNDKFENEVKDCYNKDQLLMVKVEDEDDDIVVINPNNILYARFKDI